MRQTRRLSHHNPMSRRNNDIPVIGTIHSPYDNFEVQFKKDLEAGYIISTTVIPGVEGGETVNLRRLNDEPSFYSEKGFFKDFPFDFERHGRVALRNPRMRRNTGDHEDANTSPILPCIEFMGKKEGEPSLNWAKALFSLTPDKDGNYFVTLKKFDGEENCALDRADVTFTPDQIEYAKSLYNELAVNQNEAARYRIIDSYLNPDTYQNPRRKTGRSMRRPRRGV